MKDFNDVQIAIVGLGYVGLPLLVEFNKNFECVGYDHDQSRVNELRELKDRTLEVSKSDLRNVKLKITSELTDIKKANVYIITVPTPIDIAKRPDFTYLIEASKNIGLILSVGDTVIYESTVYPGATEEICIPILEKYSGLKFNEQFYCGYSPERINPGDHKNRLTDIVKITSGSNETTSLFVDQLYSKIIKAGTHRVSTIKVAEAAKVIENVQRDLNIALMNELSIIFDKLHLDTNEILDAACTKWNFINFRPGFVGGHCIGVDPYYLTHKAQMIGYSPELLLSGRRLNDSMAKYVADLFIQNLSEVKKNISGSKVLVMGLTFKEDCPDLRNSKVFDLIERLEDFGLIVDCMDPWLDSDDLRMNSNRTLTVRPKIHSYDGIIVSVGHTKFKNLGLKKIKEFAKKQHLFYDLKGLFHVSESDYRL